MDRKIDLLIGAHTELQDQVRFGDSKATAIITFKLVMLAFLRTQVGDINEAYHNQDMLVIGLFSLFMVTFMISTIYILKVIVPRVVHTSNKKSSIFFSEIADMTKDEFRRFAEQYRVTIGESDKILSGADDDMQYRVTIEEGEDKPLSGSRADILAFLMAHADVPLKGYGSE